MADEQTTTEQTTQPEPQPAEPKLLTQEDFDKAFSARLAKEKAKLEKEHQSSEEYQAYKKWQETQKTDNERIQGQLKDLETAKQTLTEKLLVKTLEAAGIDPDYTESVIAKVNKLVVDKGVEFDDALTEFMKDPANGKYTKQQAETQGVKLVTPSGNTGNKGITKEQFDKMSYKQKLEIYNTNPNLYKTFTTN